MSDFEATVGLDTEDFRREVRKLIAAERKLKDERVDATKKLGLMVQKQELAVQIAKKQGVSVAAARKAVNAFGKDIDRATKEAGAYAVKLDKAERETKEFTRAQREASKATRVQVSRLGALSGAYSTLAGAAGVGLLTRGLLSSIQAAEKQADVMAQVESRLKSMGNTLGMTTQEIADMASEIQFTTGVADEDILRLASQFATFGKITRDSFRPGIEAAINMSEVMQTDLNASLLQVAKALDDPIRGLTALRRSGTQLSAQQEQLVKDLVLAGRSAEAQRVILKELDKQYGDAAASARKFGGASKALTTEFGDLKEEVGRIALEEGGLRTYFEILTQLTRATRDGAAENVKTTRTMGPLGDAYRSVALAMALAAEWQSRFGKETEETEEAVTIHVKTMDRFVDVGDEAVSWAQAMAAALPPVNREWDRSEKSILATEKALAAVTDKGTELRETARLMRAFGISAEDAGDAARLQLASGVGLADQRVVQLVADLKDARAQLDLIAQSQAAEVAQGFFAAFPGVRPGQGSGGLGPVAPDLGTPGFPAGVNLGDFHRMQADAAKLESDAIKARVKMADDAAKDGLKTRKKASKAALEQQQDAQKAMFDGFTAVANTLGLLDSDLGRIVGSVINALSSISSSGGGAAGAAGTAGQVAGAFGGGGAGGGGAGGIGAGLAAAAPVIAAFVAVFDAVSASIERKRARVFGLPISTETTGGVRTGQAIGTGAVGDVEAIKAVHAMNDAIDDFRVSVGFMVTDLDKIGVQVRADGEKFQLLINDTVFGVFESFESAFAEGLRIAVGEASLEGIGPILSEALGRVGFGRTVEELAPLIPLLRQLDDVNAGLTVTYSAAKTTADQWLTSLDITSEQLLRLGVSIGDVTAFREREIQAQKDQILASGAALAGVSLNLGRFAEWAAAAEAFGDAQETEIARQEALLAAVESRIAEPTSGPLDGKGEVGGGGRDAGDAAGEASGPIGDFGKAIAMSGKQAEEAAGRISQSFIDMIRESVAIQGELGFLSEIASFQEAFGVQVMGNQELQMMIAELEFRSAQIRIQLLVRELELNAASLGITEAQMEAWRGFAQEIAAFEFSDAKVRGGGGRRKQKQEEQRRAAEAAAQELESFTEELTVLSRNAGSASGTLGDLAAQLAEVAQNAAAAAEAGMSAADAAEFQRLQLQQIRRDFLEPFSTEGRRENFISAEQDIEQTRRAAMEEAALIAAEQAENLGIPVEVAFRAMEETINDWARRMNRDLVAEMVDGLNLPLENTRKSMRESRKAFKDLRLSFERGAISSRKYESLLEQVHDAQEAALGGDLLNLIDQYYGEIEGGEEFRRKLEIMRFELEMANMNLRFQMLVAEGMLAQEAIDTLGGFLEFMNANPPDWDAYFAGATTGGGGGGGGGGSGSPLPPSSGDVAADITNLAAAIRDFIRGFESTDVGRFETQARDWIAAFEDFDREVGDAMNLDLGGMSARDRLNQFAQSFGMTIEELIASGNALDLADLIPEGHVFHDQLIAVLEAMIADADLGDLEAAAPGKLLDMYRGTLDVTSALQSELDAINAEYLDITTALDLMGGSAEQLAEAGQIHLDQLEAFWARATEGIKDLLQELTGGASGGLSGRAVLENAQSRYQSLRDRLATNPQDLDALSQIEEATRDYLAAAQAFTGGSGPIYSRIVADVIATLSGIDPTSGGLGGGDDGTVGGGVGGPVVQGPSPLVTDPLAIIANESARQTAILEHMAGISLEQAEEDRVIRGLYTDLLDRQRDDIPTTTPPFDPGRTPLV